jgi:hypothetical protein
MLLGRHQRCRELSGSLELPEPNHSAAQDRSHNPAVELGASRHLWGNATSA